MFLMIILNYAKAGVTAREHVLARGGPRRVVARPSICRQNAGEGHVAATVGSRLSPIYNTSRVARIVLMCDQGADPDQPRAQF